MPAKLCMNPAYICAMLLLCIVAGCANPGPPRPPSLHLPKIVADLSAEREGDQVRLHWTTPAKTTDELKMDGVVTAELCRSAAAGTCTPVSRRVVQPGPSETTDPLPSTLRDDPQLSIQYQVRLLNGQQHSAGYSAPAFAAAGAAPPMVTGLKVQATAQGALLEWEPKDAADSIELDRHHSANVLASSVREKGRPKAPKEPDELHLHADRVHSVDTPFRADAGGTLDPTARPGETYVYTVQRVRKVVLAGNALEIRSTPSPPVSITLRDTFPPRSPTGLETIAARPGSASPIVDLSWRPNTEADLAGYLVYRQELSAVGAPLGPRVKMTLAPVLEPGFHDATAVAGHIYSYTVTAIDETGNESAPGTPAREALQLP